MQIGEVASKVGMRPSRIRFYEDAGILPEPERTPVGYRTYDETTIDRLRFVRDCQAMGLRLDEIKHILSLKERGAKSCGHSLALLESRVADIEAQMKALARLRRRLLGVIDNAAGLDFGECSDPVSCQVLSSDRG